jgi:hypothetical protein
LAASGLAAKFGTIQLYMTWLAALASAGPRSAGEKKMSPATSGSVSCDVRHADSELRM